MVTDEDDKWLLSKQLLVKGALVAVGVLEVELDEALVIELDEDLAGGAGDDTVTGGCALLSSERKNVSLFVSFIFIVVVVFGLILPLFEWCNSSLIKKFELELRITSTLCPPLGRLG